MITHVKASADIGKEPLLFQSVVVASVPLDKKAPEIIFSVLDSEKGEVINVSEEDGHLVKFGKDPFMVRALGLNTCAAVCFVNREYSDDLTGYVYHALSGTVRQNTFEKIMKEIEASSPYRRIEVIYAHPKGSDQGYRKNMDELDLWLRGNAKVVEVTHVPGVSFAMNQSVQVGY
jgi:hypothetical protein